MQCSAAKYISSTMHLTFYYRNHHSRVVMVPQLCRPLAVVIDAGV
jgi:hypothetical protein